MNYKMKAGISRTGYNMVSIRDKDHKCKVFNLGRLVLMVFKPHPLMFDRGMIECDHIDCNPLNNNLDNLRWLLREENAKLRNLKNKRHYHKRGVILIRYRLDEMMNHVPYKAELYARQADTDLPYSVATTLLKYGHYSRKYMCRLVYLDKYKDDMDAVFRDFPGVTDIVAMTARTTRDRKVGCYNEKGEEVKVYDSITSTENDGFSLQKVYRAARDGKPYMNLEWRFID
jgi:hypothetical protein